ELLLQAGVPLDIGTVQLRLGGGMYGTVLGPAGTAPPDCQLTLRIDNHPGEISAEYVGGSYRFSEVPAGTHTVLVQSGQEAAAMSFRIKFEAGVDLPRDIELQVGLTRRIRVQVPATGGEQVRIAMY